VRLAFLFPGQGSQSVGMGASLAADYPEIKRDYFDRADEILGLPISRLCFEGPEGELVKTEIQQPAIFLVSCAAAAALRSHGVTAEAVAGHSLGEYSALVEAGSFSFEDGLRLTRRRGELMASIAAETGGIMAAVLGLPSEEVVAICREVEPLGVCEPANFNSPTQTVISGEDEPVRRAMDLARERGARRVIELSVSAPFHCSLMAPLARQFRPVLDAVRISDVRVPVVANVTAQEERTADEIRENLIRQLDHSVRWTESVLCLAAGGIDTVVEVGPGKVLTGLMRQIDSAVRAYSTGSPGGIETVAATLQASS
jgi:[acyl-carrier-protein] S-malonyltransferase